ncbi:hypothetical protein QFW77_12310 [Luteimonas sp. RD2P54]|uniref:Methyltransferase domain-containing protein n=1 Tax=Luteimonas endophytica TaxID=3042023 RepID=A0ABT6JC39_9GAMM|nr:hypothetical protein [Luteimonas endophytica]MDH5823768.1 hypothetical protein [Luteimonas endophytica]
MPATSPAGQPGNPSDWFATPAGRAVVESEAALVRRALDEQPGRQWLWLAPAAQPAEPAGRGLRLHPRGEGWDGGLRCALPLPLASESIGTIVLQHAAAPGGDPAALFEECARLLLPGGRLWLFALNPLSPYCWRWRGRGLAANEPLTWRRRLRRAGLEPEPVSQGVGPGWEVAVRTGQRSGPGLCAAYALCAERRVAPLTPVAPRTALRMPQGAAPA